MSLSKQTPKPKYCKVCHDTGKDEKTYTSHYVRETPDPTSRIVCPTLLSMECKYCYKKGHTVKFCKVIKNRSHKQEKTTSRPIEPQVSNKNVTKSNNMYDLLDCDDVDENVVGVTKLHRPPHILSTPAPLNYSKIIDVTNKQVEDEERERIIREQKAATERAAKEEAAKVLAEKPMIMPVARGFTPFRRASMLNWADDTSSDEDEREREDHYEDEYLEQAC